MCRSDQCVQTVMIQHTVTRLHHFCKRVIQDKKSKRQIRNIDVLLLKVVAKKTADLKESAVADAQEKMFAVYSKNKSISL
jgi:hypothetical protein